MLLLTLNLLWKFCCWYENVVLVIAKVVVDFLTCNENVFIDFLHVMKMLLLTFNLLWKFCCCYENTVVVIEKVVVDF